LATGTFALQKTPRPWWPTGCDAVMIGRAAPANPWIFRQIAQYTATGSYERPTVEDRYRMIRAYFQMLLDEAEATKDLPRAARLGETAGKMKQFATWFTHGVAGGAKLRGGHLPRADRRRGAGPGGRVLRDAVLQLKRNPVNSAQIEIFPENLDSAVTI
jgi:tRNA-dihydrouridine synthase